jgi:hypothetical protein
VLKISTVPSGDGQVVDEGGRRDEAVLDRHGAAGSTKRREKLRPSEASPCLPWQANQTLNTGIEPPVESCPPLSLGQKKNAEANFTEDDRVHARSREAIRPPWDRGPISWAH